MFRFEHMVISILSNDDDRISRFNFDCDRHTLNDLSIYNHILFETQFFLF